MKTLIADAGLLVLSRHRDESIVVAVDGKVVAEILVVDIRGDKARLGVSAPKSVAVHRREVWDAIQRDKANEEPAA